MGKKSLSSSAYLISLLGLLLTGLLVVYTAASAQEIIGPNLLVNSGFEEGHYNQDGISEITVPNGWRMHWSNGELIFGGEWPTARPETVVWNATGGIPVGEEIFWKDGIYTMKVFKSWAPVWAAISQDVANLEVGRKYRLVAPIFIDIVEEYEGGQKIIPWRKDTGRVRLGASPVGAAWRNEGAIAYSGWWTAESIDPFYQAYPTFIYDFVATQPNMTIWIEMASTYPYANNGFFFDTPGLFALNETAAAPPPVVQPAAQSGQTTGPVVPAQPLPTIAPPAPREDGSVVHVVQAGESLWGIAIQYASAMGLPAEEALPRIQELNNNPAFIQPGSELLIIPAPAAAPAAEEAAPVEDAAPAEGETPAEEAAAGEGEAPAEEETGAAEAEAPAEAAAEEVANAETQTLPIAGTICVATFNDTNADGQRNDNEPLVANAAISIGMDGRTVETYITDGASEPYCFELTEAGSFQLQLYPPAGFIATTEDNWAVAIANNESYTVSFGLTDNAQVVEARSSAVADASAVTVAEETTAETAETSNALTNNLGYIVLGVAGLLLVLAGIGVFLLRRG